jgi:hypothetical protein
MWIRAGSWLPLLAVACQPSPKTIQLEPSLLHFSASGAAIRLKAVPLDERGKVVPSIAITFESASPTVATVTPDGLVTARRSGRTQVRVTGGGIAGTAAVVVAIPSAMSVVPQELTLVGIGAKGELQTRVVDENGEPVPDQGAQWSSADTSVLTVAGGVLTATGIGKTNVRAIVGALRAEATVVVDEPPFEAVRVDEPRIMVREGELAPVHVRALDAQGVVVPGVGFQFAMDDTDVAVVDRRGMVRGVAHGRTRLVVSAGHAKADTEVDVLGSRKPATRAAPQDTP